MLKPTIKLMLTIVPSRPRPRTNAPPVHQTTSVLPRECLTLAPPLAPFTSTCTFVHTDCNGYRLARPPKHDNSITDKSLSVRHSIARSELLLAFAFLPPSGRMQQLCNQRRIRLQPVGVLSCPLTHLSHTWDQSSEYILY